jgi:hypothetical protein
VDYSRNIVTLHPEHMNIAFMKLNEKPIINRIKAVLVEKRRTNCWQSEAIDFTPCGLW